MTSDKLQMISALPRINEMLRISMNFESRISNSESRIENRILLPPYDLTHQPRWADEEELNVF
jgi:hypothetical protein